MYRTLQNTHIYLHAHVSKLRKEEEKSHVVFGKGAALGQRGEHGVWNCAFQLLALLPGTMPSSIITPELAFHLRGTVRTNQIITQTACFGLSLPHQSWGGHLTYFTQESSQATSKSCEHLILIRTSLIIKVKTLLWSHSFGKWSGGN